MRLNALVMSRSHSSVRTLLAAFAELGIEYRISMSASETIETLAAGHHSALVVDFDLPHAVQVAKLARSISGKRKPVLFGMIGAETPIGGVFQAGANFALYKPLDLLPVLHALRAGQGFMQADRRRSSRSKSETLAYLQLPTGTAQVVHATGDFIWADDQGRAGLFFQSVPAACRRDLQAWLKKQGAKKSESVRALLEPQKNRRAMAASH